MSSSNSTICPLPHFYDPERPVFQVRKVGVVVAEGGSLQASC